MKLRLAPLAVGIALSCAPGEKADIILHGGKIVTLDADSSVGEAIAVRGDRVLAVGSDATIRTFGGPQTETFDLSGKTVVPGFADNHYHSVGGGAGVDLSRARSLREVLDAIALRASETETGEIVLTNSDWHEGQLAEQRLPFRDDLDRASPDRPVVVVRGGHQYVLNSAALAKWSIDESTPSPEGGSIGRYPDGRLNGELVDTAKRLVELPPRPEPGVDSMAEELGRLNAAGLTSIRYASASPEFYRRLEEMKARGLLTLRVSVLLRLGPEADLEAIDEWGIGPDDGDTNLRVAGIKLGVDGGFEGGWMREAYEEPYGVRGTFYGLQTFPTDGYIALVRGLNERGWRVATHAVGDAAIDLVLDAYEKANADRSIVGKRWVIEHGFVPADDQLPRIKALELHLSAQHHLYVAGPSLVKYWGEERAHRVTPVRTYLDAGLAVSLGTDAPVIPYPPLWVLYHFITRDTISAGVMGADQRIGREEALRAMSLGGAALTFEENVKGSLEPGKYADLVVLEEDVLTCEPERIRDMEISLTMVGGRIVFRRQAKRL